jgi:RNA polymerase sigma-70 factor, ECF subfamily
MKSLRQKFEEAALPLLGAAYNLARWLTRNDTEAEDVVQEAYLRAFKHFGSFHGGDCRPWLLTIVRNTCYTWMRQNRAAELMVAFDEETHTGGEDNLNPETLLLKEADNMLLKQALEELPAEFREVIVLRELEGLSYKQIADVAEVPMGTVMSRLARARKRLQQTLTSHRKKETSRELAVKESDPHNSCTRRANSCNSTLFRSDIAQKFMPEPVQ